MSSGRYSQRQSIMLYYFAPMEGITGHVFRRVHKECFPEMV